jgi:hypothetical protein
MRRVVTSFVIVLALLAGGSVTASCTTSSSGKVIGVVRPTITQQGIYDSGVWVSFIFLTVLFRAINPNFRWSFGP